jgi:D-alanyl-D-alanine carboxypeptidase
MPHTVALRKAFSFLALFMAVIFIFSALLPTAAEAKVRHKHHAHGRKHHHALPVAADALYADIVIEARTGRVLHEVNADRPRHPASLTKMMTLYLTFQALEAGKLRLDQRLPVSATAAKQSPSKLGLRRGQSIRVGDAILGVVTESANDAAVVLAEAMGGSETRFAQMMTRQAKTLGMKQTTFRNASGLPDPGQITTAQDMAVLAHALIYHYPQFYAFFSHETFAYGRVTYHNHNHLMERYDGMDGIKTGYVRASGFNLVASATRGNLRLIGVVFGGRSTVSRDNQMAQLLDQGFAMSGAKEPPVIHQAQTQTQVEAQGDGRDIPDNSAVALPTKVATVAAPPPHAPAVVAPPRIEKAPVAADTGASKAAEEAPAPADWGIQIGAYNDPNSGRLALAALARNMPSSVGEAEQILQKVTSSDGSVIYRARFEGFEQRVARSICAYMTQHGQSCLVIAPGQ